MLAAGSYIDFKLYVGIKMGIYFVSNSLRSANIIRTISLFDFYLSLTNRRQYLNKIIGLSYWV